MIFYVVFICLSSYSPSSLPLFDNSKEGEVYSQKE